MHQNKALIAKIARDICRETYEPAVKEDDLDQAVENSWRNYVPIVEAVIEKASPKIATEQDKKVLVILNALLPATPAIWLLSGHDAKGRPIHDPYTKENALERITEELVVSIGNADAISDDETEGRAE